MARRFPLLALLFVLALTLAACPEDVEEAVEDEEPTEPIEQVRDAASNTLGADSAEITILLQADPDATAETDDGAADDDVTAPEDDNGLEDDDNGLEDDNDAATTEDDGDVTDDGTEDDLDATDPTDDTAADQDEVELTGDEDFSADRRQLTATNGAGDQFELIVDGSDLYILMNGDAVTTGDTGDTDAPTDDATPTEEDDDNGVEDDAATDEDDDNGLEDDDDAATDEDDDTATDEDDDAVTDDDDAADEQWGWFDLNELYNGDDATDDDNATEDENATEDDDTATDQATTATTADGDLERFPFRDSHLVLQVLEDVEGDVSESQDADDEGFTVYDVNVNVQETETTDDGQEWLERLANGEDQVTITVWIDDEYVVQVEYEHGTATDATAPEDDAVTDDEDDAAATDDDNGLEDDDNGLEDDDDAATTDDDNGLEDDDNGLEDDDTTATDEDDDTAVTDDDDTAVTDDDEFTATDEDALTVTIEYRNLGEGAEIELPDDDQVVEIDEQELRQLLPSLPGENGDATAQPEPTG